MGKVKITLPDRTVLEYDAGITVAEVAYSIGAGLGRAAIAGKIDGNLVDLNTGIKQDAELSIITLDSKEGLDIYRHTAAHIMAQAVKRIYGDVKLAIGPAIEDGFYYDFDLEERISQEDFARIEEEMKKIIKEDLPISRKVMNKEEAINLMQEKGEIYKVELIEEMEDEEVSFYQQGEFMDLCRGPHLPSTGRVKAFKLLNTAGAYWRGDEKNKMLQRIYATAFAKQAELDLYLERLEEAKKRDHRRLGKELELFSFHDEGRGFPFIHPKGMVLRNELIDFWKKEHRKAGYEEVMTPIVLNQSLWQQSGHCDHYQENIYFTEIDDELQSIKQMNCPGGILIYKSKMRSYRDLPIRMGELGVVHRHEKSGTLHGLMRVRNFTQDDAHIFCLPSQIVDELTGVIKLVDTIYSAFNFNYKVELSTRPENAMGSEEMWDMATAALKEAIEKNELAYEINEGDGAFYGPKIDFHLEDSLGRTWQCGTIQLDFQMPERFDLSYIGEDGKEHRPVMIHRAIYGSLERFMGILIEHYAGAFPAWLAPVQVKVLPVSAEQIPYAELIREELAKEDIRVEVDAANEKLGYKIRQAQLEKVPYMLVVGKNEEEDKSVAVRDRREGDLGSMSLADFREKVLKEIMEKLN